MKILRELLGRWLDQLYSFVRERILDLVMGMILRLLGRQSYLVKLAQTS